ncbi:unnamed protein product [Adineta ricciae]|nr:unnamed protein product [Adineta ricciae]
MPSIVDQRQHRIKRISIGLGIFLFILSLAFPVYIIKIYFQNAIVKNNIPSTIRVSNPTLQQYFLLYSDYSETLTCPCTQPSMNYGKILEIDYILHPVCSSIFVSEEWILSFSDNNSPLFFDDFRMTASYAFQTLQTLCMLSQQTIENNLMKFYSEEYINLNILPPVMFQPNIELRVSKFMEFSKNDFLLSFTMIRKIIQANGLLSGLQTNYQFMAQNTEVHTISNIYNGCSCSVSPTCITQSMIYDVSSYTSLFSIPGFYTGCYVVESLLQSNLQCFFNQTCLDQLLSYISTPMTVQALNESLLFEDFINSAIRNLTENLMVELINLSINYENYYEKCQPIFCSYVIETPSTTETRNYTIYIIGLVIGIIGGVISILHLIIPTLVTLIVRNN